MICVISKGLCARVIILSTAMGKKAQNAKMCTEMIPAGSSTSVISVTETLLWNPVCTD